MYTTTMGYEGKERYSLLFTCRAPNPQYQPPLTGLGYVNAGMVEIFVLVKQDLINNY